MECDKYKIVKSAERMEVSVYEWPLPENIINIYAALFELRMPKSVCDVI